jgi:hypothetical protein
MKPRPLGKVSAITRMMRKVGTHIPMKFKRRGGRKEIILAEGMTDAKSSGALAQDAQALVRARAHWWQELLDTGQAASIMELADRLRTDRSNVGRILRLTLLAPGIVEAILDGREPSGLSLVKLTKPFPLLWGEQGTHFGFPLLQQASR